MPAKDLVITVPGNATGTRGKYSPLPSVPRVPAYAGYMIGRNYWPDINDVVRDLSGNGRNGTLGVAIGSGTLTGVSGIRVLTGGSGYTSATVSLPGGATAVVQIFGGAVVDVALTAVGTGLTPGTYPLTITGDGTGATAQYTVGDGIGEMSMCAPGQWMDTPFTGAQLLSRTGKASLLVINRQAAGQQQYPIGDRLSGTADLVAQAWNGSSAAISGQSRNGSTQINSNSADMAAARLGFQFALSTHTLTRTSLYWSKYGSGLITATAGTGSLTSISSTRLQRIGKDYSGSTGIASVALAMWWDDELNSTEAASIYAQAVQFMTSQDLYIAR